jgi:hypothetical protein
VRRTIFVHMNNTNPILLADTPERRIVEDRAWRWPWTASRSRCSAVTTTTGTTGITRTGVDDFVETLRAHSRRYHDQHPFHVRMNAGR